MRVIARSLVALIIGSVLLIGLVAPVAAASYRDCSGKVPGPGADLHRCDLQGSTLRIDLTGANLSSADLRDVIAGCDPDLPSANMTAAKLYNSDLRRGLFCDVGFVGADLHGADLRGASFEDANFRGANLASADMDDASSGFVSFENAWMANVRWRDGDGVANFMNGADMHGADLRGTYFAAARFVGTNLRGARLDRVDLSRADLTGADLHKATGLLSIVWGDTTCVDGSNSDANGGTCLGHLT